MEQIRISFNTGRRDFVKRGQFQLFVFLAMFVVFIFIAESFEGRLMAAAVVLLITFIMIKSTQKIIFENGDVLKMNYFGSSKIIKPKRIFVLKLDTGNRFFLEYENERNKKKKVFLSGEPEDFKEVYKSYKDIIIFSKRFKALVSI